MLGQNFDVQVSVAAQNQWQQAKAHYKDISLELSQRFSEKIAEKIESLPRFWAYEMLDFGYRKIRASPFPYFVFFQVDEEAKTITIKGIWHERAMPKL
jgi:mRNA-degrading endonuclease RelE of RelBE toxin-antitoxin system